MEGHWADPQLVPHTQYHYRITAVNGLGEAGEPSEIISITTGPISMARGRPYTKSIQPHPTYSDIGESASTDGFYAGPYRDRRSYGYRLEKVGDELAVAVTVDIENVATISRVINHNCGGAGYSLDTLHVSVSTDGENWTAVGGADFISANLLSAGFPEIKARYVRFEFTKQRSGNNDDWLFLDELEVF